MTPRWGRVRSAAVLGLGLALGPWLSLFAPETTTNVRAAEPVASRPRRIPTLYHKSRSFRIPFNVDVADRPRLKEVQLFASSDLGYHYDPASRTTPDRPSFTFRASRDGEYWFTVRTVDLKGNLYPADDDTPVEPSMKVIVDTAKPVIVLEPDGRRGGVAAVRWEVKDAHLDLKSLVLEYQVDGGRDWRNVPISRPALIGGESWDAGTAEPIRARLSVSDKAGNSSETTIDLADGTPMQPGMASAPANEFGGSPPVSRISSGPEFAAGDDGSKGSDPMLSGRDPFPPIEPFPGSPAASPSAPAISPMRTPAAAVPPTNGGGNDAFNGPGIVSGGEPAAGSSTAAAGSETEANPAQTMLLDRAQFPLQYAVDDAGPNGPASVELWVTRNGGRTWIKKADDPDRVSPFPVDLGAEGTFGLRVVARSATGQGDAAPMSGDPPHLTVDVDTTAPTVQMKPPVVGLNQNAGKLAIQWGATDRHLGPKPVTILWRPDQAGSQWQPVVGPIENTGKFIWAIPGNLPAKIHVRVEAADDAGNRGFAETAEGSPVLVDQSKPKSRILGLDPSIRAGMAPGARPLR